MERLCAIIITFSLVFTLCSCRKNSNDLPSSSFFSNSTYNSETSEITNTITDNDVSNTESSNSISNDTVSSKPIVDDSLKEEVKNASSENTSTSETIQDEPQQIINFVPNRIPMFDSEETFISYYNEVFYKGVKYAATRGQNNGVDCYAIVTVGNNDEYLSCIAIFDNSNDVHTVFNIYNDRIYYLQYVMNDPRDYTLLNSFSICSMNLSGKDKRIEKKVDLPFTHINCESNYLNSKYLFFTVDNLFDGVYDIIYRYNAETQELINLNQKLGAHKTIFSIEEKVLVYSFDDQEIYQYDIDFNNKNLFFDAKNYSWDNFVENGFIYTEKNTNIKYFLDLSGNFSAK